jgi:tetratricopeptide (TPR) repeat protein
VLERRRDRLASDALETVLTPDEQFDLEEARHLLVEVTIDRPRWGMVPRLLSEIAEIRGDRSLAIGELQRAIDLGGRQWATLRRLAIMLHAAGRYDEAREVIRDLEGHGGTGVERIVADMEARGGRVSAALARGERITPENCRDPLQWMWFGRLLAGCGRSNQAEAALRRAVDVAPDRLDARLALIRYLVSQGRRGEAREAIRRAEQAIPAERRDLFTVRALETLEDVSGAESLHREKVASAPEDLDAARGLAEFLIRSGQETQARVELRRIMALDGAQGTPTLGWAKRMLAIRLAKESYPEFLEALALDAGHRFSRSPCRAAFAHRRSAFHAGSTRGPP